MPIGHARSETRGRSPVAVAEESSRTVRQDPQDLDAAWRPRRFTPSRRKN